ncbi:MAG: SEL1-like repeat protein, partial [Terriglobales bacterium]
MLGLMFLNGAGLGQDDQQAAVWIQKAAG